MARDSSMVPQCRCRLAVGAITICVGWMTCSAPVLATEPDVALVPVFQVDLANPTRDKPQSKLWFAHGTWWAWLPTQQGSSVWRRTSTGWRRQTELDAALAGLPGRADVWAAGDTARAVLVEKNRLAVVALQYSRAQARYLLASMPAQFELDSAATGQEIETATIARDGQGRWWIAYPWQRRMWIRATCDPDGHAWTEPVALSEEAAEDDLCTIVCLPSGIGLIWSDQKNDTMSFRWHNDGAASDDWGPMEIIDHGNRTADDHLNAAVANDGTLYLATKNSVDQIGAAQLVLRARHPDGRWENFPYAPRTDTAEPSRPIVQLGGAPDQLLLVHTLYGRGKNASSGNQIAWYSVPGLTQMFAELLPSQSSTSPMVGINNVTGSKGRVPPRQPWLVLASDAGGQVYEIRMDPQQPEPALLAGGCASAFGPRLRHRCRFVRWRRAVYCR